MTCLNPVCVKYYDKFSGTFEKITVPCGKCINCLSSRRASWSYRLYHEFLASACAWFVTLTYDDEHLPEDGVRKDHIQKFLKRFRKNYGKCRYYISAEYGDKLGRPHYHGLLFFPEMVELTEVVNEVSKAWKLGNIQVGEVNLSTINYCSKYSMKPRYEVNGIYGNKTFSLMSRKPGIGEAFIHTPESWKVVDNLQNHVVLNGLTYNLPRYYKDKLFDEEDKHLIKQKIKEHYGTEKRKKQERNSEWYFSVEQRTKRLSSR